MVLCAVVASLRAIKLGASRVAEPGHQAKRLSERSFVQLREGVSPIIMWLALARHRWSGEAATKIFKPRCTKMVQGGCMWMTDLLESAMRGD